MKYLCFIIAFIISFPDATLIEEIEKYIIQDNNIFIEEEHIEPSKLVDLNIKGRRFCFGVTSMNIRKGEIKHYY